MSGSGEESSYQRVENDEKQDEVGSDKYGQNLNDTDDDGSVSSSSSSSSSEPDDGQAASTDRYWPPPTSETVEISAPGAAKSLLAFDINSAGTRFAIGGNDNQVCVYDFQVIDQVRPRPIGIFDAQASVQQLEFSIDNELLLVIPTTCQAVIIPKDGSSTNKKTCAKGDPYLRGAGVTKGHTHMLTDGCWAPGDRTKFVTCGMDATIRFWDLNNLTKQTLEMKTSSPENGRRILPVVCAYSRDSNTVFSGNNDGTILMLDVRRRRFDAIKRAHNVGDITGLDQSYGQSKLCSRSEDGTCKLWDLRQPKQALGVHEDLPTSAGGKTNCIFSPDDKFIVTSSSAELPDGTTASGLHFIDALSIVERRLTTRLRTEAPVGSGILRTRWHAKINHLGYTTSSGQLLLSFDSLRSQGGGFLHSSGGAGGRPSAQLQANKRRKYELATSSTGAGGGATAAVQRIITPHALPLFRDSAGSAAASFAKVRQDPRQSYKPQMPAANVAAKPAGSTLSSHIARNIARPVAESMSIRDRILRHASGGGGAGADGNAPAGDGAPPATATATTATGGPAQGDA